MKIKFYFQCKYTQHIEEQRKKKEFMSKEANAGFHMLNECFVKYIIRGRT